MTEFTHRLPHAGWSKPSKNEEEYFRRREFQERMERALRKEQARADSDRRAWLEAHRDRCPKCGSALESTELEDVQVDQCPTCRGVWMDKSVFDALTHPHEPNEYLTNLLRGVLLEYTTGKLPETQEGGD